MRLILAAIVAALYLACMAWLAAEDGPTFTLAIGPVHAYENEAAECYFDIGYGSHATMVAFHPKNMSCERMRELIGKKIRLQAVVEP